MAASAAFNALGGLGANNQLSGARHWMQNQAQFNPTDVNGPFGSANYNNGQWGIGEDSSSAALRTLLGQGGQYNLMGGMFQNPNLQNALSGVNLGGEYGYAQNAAGAMQPGTAFGGVFGNGMLANQLYGSGAQNLANAGNVGGLIQQNLDASRNLAAPYEQQATNQFFNREFMNTRGATSGANERQQNMFTGLLNADQQRILNAQQLGQQQQQYLGGLGMQQIGQGLGAESQGFQQMLGANQFNMSAGQQRLQNAMNMFGFGNNIYNQSYGLGLQSQNALLNQNQFWQNMILGLNNAEANRIGSAGQFSQGYGGLAQAQGGLLGGLGSAVGGLFG